MRESDHDDHLGAHERGGGCLCGAVRFALRSPAKWCAHCHCSRCQRAHGAAFVTWVGVNIEDFRLLAGAELTWYRSTASSERGFCRRCGSPLLFRADRWPGEIHVARASVPGALDPAPAAHVFFDTHAPWTCVDEHLPRFGGATGTEPLA